MKKYFLYWVCIFLFVISGFMISSSLEYNPGRYQIEFPFKYTKIDTKTTTPYKYQLVWRDNSNSLIRMFRNFDDYSADSIISKSQIYQLINEIIEYNNTENEPITYVDYYGDDVTLLDLHTETELNHLKSIIPRDGAYIGNKQYYFNFDIVSTLTLYSKKDFSKQDIRKNNRKTFEDYTHYPYKYNIVLKPIAFFLGWITFITALLVLIIKMIGEIRVKEFKTNEQN